MAKVKVTGKNYEGLLSEHPLRPGQMVDLGFCLLRADGAGEARVVGIWKKGEKEPWWLATRMRSSVRRLGMLFDRRTSIEEQFRDSKGARYGAQFKWTHFQTPEALDRLWLLMGLALISWTASGTLACKEDETLLMMSKSKGARRSLIAVGKEAKQTIELVLRLSWAELRQILPEAVFRPVMTGGKK